MKVRKVQIKNYKMFSDFTVEFVNSNNETLNTVVIAGINGAGKTSFLFLLQRLFCETFNLFKVKKILSDYDQESDALICDEINVEVEFSGEEKQALIALIHKIENKFHQLKKVLRDNTPPIDSLTNLRKNLNKNNFFSFQYKLEKIGKDFIIKNNDFRPFAFFPEDELDEIFKILYFSAHHTDIKKTEEVRISSLLSSKSTKYNSIQSDGIVFPIDIFTQQKTVDEHILSQVQNKVIDNRELAAKDVIQEYIDNINAMLKGIKLKTVLVDVDSEKPIFKSPTNAMISSDKLSGGEKQLYYKAILFDKLKPKHSIIMVDEPETSLHPIWQHEVLNLYKNIPGDNQVILVTHSPHIIASVHPESLFIFRINEDNNTLECVNAEQEGWHTKGIEPNDVLDEIMGAPLRNSETQQKIDRVVDILKNHPDKINMPENEGVIESLISELGRADPLTMRILHKLAILQEGK